MSEPKRPLKPSELGMLYPKAKSYDELRADTIAMQKRRDSRLPKHPKLRIAAILLALAVTFWGILEIILPIVPFNPMFAVPAGILLELIWLYMLALGLRKIGELRDQIHP